MNYENWQLRKPAVYSAGGLVVSQHVEASIAGAEVLKTGGNAMDAALATGFTLGVVEPWMSGPGGCGFMLYFEADSAQVHCVDLGVVSGRKLDPGHYRLCEGGGGDLFDWPRVEGDLNTVGPCSVAVPGYVAGMGLAHSRFASLPWELLLEPALAAARKGLEVDWFATVKIAAAAAELRRHPDSAALFLDSGEVPAGQWSGELPRIGLDRMADTLDTLARRGADDFYRGDLAAALVSDCADAGAFIGIDDMLDYRARILAADSADYRGRQVYYAPGLTAGPTLACGLAEIARWVPAPGADEPDTRAYTVYARALCDAYRHRFEHMGAGDSRINPSSTTHFSTADKNGNVAVVTQTLLSVFGSRWTTPSLGILMNNGIMWFDPRPGRPNSIAAGKRPLSNMCPALVRSGARLTSFGASGGRRILAAVTQLISFVVDYAMDIEKAAHFPRIDYSGEPPLFVDRRLSAQTIEALGTEHQVAVKSNGVYPNYFACPNLLEYDLESGRAGGAAFVMSPWSGAVAENSTETE